jgi:hypothetical protein
MGQWTPPLRVDATGDGCRLLLVGVTHGNGRTLQEAADDLIARLAKFALAVRSSGFRYASELGPPDHRLLEFIWELGELAARGEDIRERVFAPA